MFVQLQAQWFELPGGLRWGRRRQLDRQGPETLHSSAPGRLRCAGQASCVCQLGGCDEDHGRGGLNDMLIAQPGG